jgi:hypothetical protein
MNFRGSLGVIEALCAPKAELPALVANAITAPGKPVKAEPGTASGPVYGEIEGDL